MGKKNNKRKRDPSGKDSLKKVSTGPSDKVSGGQNGGQAPGVARAASVAEDKPLSELLHEASQVIHLQSESNFSPNQNYFAAMNPVTGSPNLALQSTPPPPFIHPSFQQQYAGASTGAGNSSLMDILYRVEQRLHAIEGQNHHMQSQLSKLGSIESKLGEVVSKVNKLENDFGAMTMQMSAFDESSKFLNEMCERVKVEQEKSSEDVRHVLKTNTVIQNEMSAFRDALTETQSRSMRDNLVFTAIPEVRDIKLPNGAVIEDTEGVLRGFLKNQMDFSNETLPEFERVHRIGPYRFSGDGRRLPRPIVAKFSKYKERETVRKRAPATLRDTYYGVNEQFPKVIEDRRKQLYPVQKIARKRGYKTSLVSDRLYINGKLFRGDTTNPSITEYGFGAPPPMASFMQSSAVSVEKVASGSSGACGSSMYTSNASINISGMEVSEVKVASPSTSNATINSGGMEVGAEKVASASDGKDVGAESGEPLVGVA